MHHACTAALTLAALCLGAALAPAQIRPNQFGFTVTTSQGRAGEFCWNFDCAPRQARAMAGEILDLEVRAPLGAPFLVGVSLAAGSCRNLPFIANQLVLDFPLVIVDLGLVGQPSAIKACHGGVEHRQLRIPGFLPSGFQFALQSVALVPGDFPGGGLAFSVAVAVTLQQRGARR